MKSSTVPFRFQAFSLVQSQITCLVVLMLSVSGLGVAAQAPSYSLVFGPGAGSHEGNGIAVDPSGNIYVTGQYQGQATIGGVTLTNAGAQDYFLASFDANGNPRWTVGAGTSGADYGTSVKIAANGDLLVSAGIFTPVDFHGTNLLGEGGRDAILARYTSNGTLLWTRVIGGSDTDEADEVAIDNDGNILLGGRINGVVGVGTDTIGTAGRQRQFLAKFDANGNSIWAKAVTTETVAAGTGVHVDANNNILFTGQERTNGQNFVRVAKYTANGEPIWIAQHAGNSSSLGTGIRTDSGGNVYVCGTFATTSITFGATTLENPNFALRGFVVKYDPNGTVLWASRAGGRAYRLAVHPDGTTYTCGFFLGTSGDFDSTSLTGLGNNDGFITKHEADGQLAWVKHAGSDLREILRSITTDADGRVHVTGEGPSQAFELPAFLYQGSVVVARMETAGAAAGPELSIRRSGESLLLSWPATDTGFEVQTAANLDQEFEPATVTLAPVPGETNMYTVPLSAGNLFFRLLKE